MADSAPNTLGPWLRLSEAADYLGVHFTTLRRWADDGEVPCIRTPGGRRRFRKEELDAFLESLRQGERATLLSPKKERQSVMVDRVRHLGIRDEPWYDQLDEAQRTTMSANGRRLIAMLMQYASRSEGGEAFLNEGVRLASHYGEMCHVVNLSLVETVRAFVLIRRSITDSLYEAGMLIDSPDEETQRLYKRVNHFLDVVLLSILESFDHARSREATNNSSPSA